MRISLISFNMNLNIVQINFFPLLVNYHLCMTIIIIYTFNGMFTKIKIFH